MLAIRGAGGVRPPSKGKSTLDSPSYSAGLEISRVGLQNRHVGSQNRPWGAQEPQMDPQEKKYIFSPGEKSTPKSTKHMLKKGKPLRN